MSERVRVVTYDTSWPTRFAEERGLLEEAIGRWATGGVHHVVGVEGLAESREAFEPLAQLGYLYAPYRADEMHWFCKPDPARRTHHLHLVPSGSRRFADELSFRDRLRADHALAAEYAALKHRLAAEFAEDREAYTAAKAGFIAAALRSSEA
jgi:GrpB-like predicted nucleotidyltransferase (UPF0157 family)